MINWIVKCSSFLWEVKLYVTWEGDEEAEMFDPLGVTDVCRDRFKQFEQLVHALDLLFVVDVQSTPEVEVALNCVILLEEQLWDIWILELTLLQEVLVEAASHIDSIGLTIIFGQLWEQVGPNLGVEDALDQWTSGWEVIRDVLKEQLG